MRRSASGWPVKTTIRQKNSIPKKIHIFCHGGLTQFVINPHTAVGQPAHLAKACCITPNFQFGRAAVGKFGTEA